MLRWAQVSKSTVLTPAEEAIVVAFCQKTLLPLDDLLGCLKDTIPPPQPQRHGISRLPTEEAPTQRKRFKTYEIGYVHIDSCELRHADLPKNRQGPSSRLLGPDIFDRVCIAHDIEHRLAKPYYPWTNGQAERMNRTIKDATIKTYHYDGLQSLKAHVLAFVTAYNFAKHLKALRWRTPYQVVCEA
ncbi:integrase, catalytic core [Azotobacter vinelandii CA]|uniref:Integrase, catalytic core n=2 Tax=Azotobacter vinelandii TaxID=354 RepID=C1DPS7_AZOVD|nr:integrase, catalytic core [Azotobacter vinelandii DJ]AGK16356.1 integrase, catalytic core [Azotobacter vinelandii CA]AGK21270.1 integrase, catalytic core [Azotobacter vinelandii CA6]GLK61674.1 hypothetical protein GCM10017624_38380 [Azotobacter vinelandii]SFY23760.1 Integrase core domain-containing protein [Azotobacter vinelandii]